MGFKLEVNIEKKPLEIPVQERLLPIGTTINLVQKINKTFGLGDDDSASQSSSLNREDSSEREQVNNRIYNLCNIIYCTEIKIKITNLKLNITLIQH